MMSKIKLSIIGVAGEGARFATGQAVKIRTLRKWFAEKYGEGEVAIANIDSAKRHPLRVLNNIRKALKGSTNVLFMPGQNIEIFAPVVTVLNKLYRCHIQYIVTGGDLAEVLKRKPFLIPYIAAYDGTHVQSVTLRDELRALGIDRAEYLPNCRDYVPAVAYDHWADDPVRVCTYSRVTKEKGILDAIDIVERANALAGRRAFCLEIYGKMYDAFAPELNAALAASDGVAKYCGVRDASQTVDTLRRCFAILFPTYFECECFAGTALDAFSARIPIIANDWLYNAEVIRDHVDGFIYPFRDNAAAAKLLYEIYTDKALYAAIQQGCEESMRRFSTEDVMGAFDKLLR